VRREGVHWMQLFWDKLLGYCLKTVMNTGIVLLVYQLFKEALILWMSDVSERFLYSYPITGLDRPLGLQEVEAPRISRQSAHEGGKAVSPTHRPPLLPGDIRGTHFCWRLSRPQGHSAAVRILSMKMFQ
jgi:hypothetical protein